MHLDGYLYFIGQEGSSSSLSSCFHGGSALGNSTHWLNRFRSPLHVWQTDDNDMRERMCERNRLAAEDSRILYTATQCLLLLAIHCAHVMAFVSQQRRRIASCRGTHEQFQGQDVSGSSWMRT